LDALDIGSINGMTEELYHQLKADLAEDQPVPVQGATGVWCLRSSPVVMIMSPGGNAPVGVSGHDNPFVPAGESHDS
jgi:hypothetical protein